MNEPKRPAADRPGSAPKTKPAWPRDQHSGEGSASALESLRRLEDSRKEPERPPDAGDAEGEPGS